MKVVVDFDLCESNALCMQAAPEVFEVRDDDFLYVLQENPPEELRSKVEEAVRRCPKQAITLEGYQYMSPAKKVAVGSQVGYQSFGKKNGVTVSNFPVDAVLKFFPKPGVGKIDIYGTGGLGFNYQRTDVGHSSNSDYFFGTQAGVGAVMHGKGAAGLIVDAVYHWVFSNGSGSNFVALRAGLLVPMMR